MRLTTKGRYGVRAVINLASAFNNRPISIKRIAGDEDISPEFLEQIFFKLKKAGIIRSLRGPGGGFVMNKRISNITVKDILDAVGEMVYPTPCTNPDIGCDKSATCPVHKLWVDFYKTNSDFLSGITLKDITDQNGSKYYDGMKKGQDFSI